MVESNARELKLKQKLEKLVVKHGGKVEQNVKDGHTSVFIETGMKIKGKNVVERGTVDVVKNEWLTSQVVFSIFKIYTSI